MNPQNIAKCITHRRTLSLRETSSSSDPGLSRLATALRSRPRFPAASERFRAGMDNDTSPIIKRTPRASHTSTWHAVQGRHGRRGFPAAPVAHGSTQLAALGTNPDGDWYQVGRDGEEIGYVHVSLLQAVTEPVEN